MATTIKPKAPSYRRLPRYQCVLVREGSYNHDENKITGTTQSRELFARMFDHEPGEVFMVAALDTKHKVIGIFEVTRGTLDASLVHPREVFRHAIVLNASSILLAHNHPSGDVEPSKEDRLVTDRLTKAGEMIGITVLDHIIVGPQGAGEPAKTISIREWGTL